MAQINSSGQVYVLNGQLQVTAGPNGYLATGSPLQYIRTLAVPANGNVDDTETIPAGARALIFIGTQALAQKSIAVSGNNSSLIYLDRIFNGTTFAAALLSEGLDTAISAVITDFSGANENVLLFWSYNLDDFGLFGAAKNDLSQPPILYGKYSLVTNPRVPTRLGDDSQTIQAANAVFSGGAGGVIVSSPGVNKCLVLWIGTIDEVANSSARAIIYTTSGAELLTSRTASDNSENITWGGLKLPANTALYCTTDINCTYAQFNVWYTVENQSEV